MRWCTVTESIHVALNLIHINTFLLSSINKHLVIMNTLRTGQYLFPSHICIIRQRVKVVLIITMLIRHCVKWPHFQWEFLNHEKVSLKFLLNYTPKQSFILGTKIIHRVHMNSCIT